MEKYDVIIIGGGPGGLCCANSLSRAGAKVVVLERKKTIGAKVCAGGITWDGLIPKIPDNLIERAFKDQQIFTGRQSFCLRRKNPVIATVNRIRLGQWLTRQALQAGADIRTGWYVRNLEKDRITATDAKGKTVRLGCGHLVGADGSASLVRRFLGIPTRRAGIGLNYQVPGYHEHMEWHLNTGFFGNGYGWIFPHRETVSIGAYGPGTGTVPKKLQHNLIRWAGTRNFALAEEQGKAELINYDYRGYDFGTCWLVGDAAGFASGLTGEGIHPAIISGEAVAGKILDPAYPADEIRRLLNKKKRHELLVKLTGRNRISCTLLLETLALMIRLDLVDFQKELSM
ncbi:MAG: NAD(P)/FAD-dependent oxidoreductase [Desulfobulbaceae bacterium]|nr:NAD(P)/FAD-dependent oxidoreductase [Desulfobulbaceae bacterium]